MRSNYEKFPIHPTSPGDKCLYHIGSSKHTYYKTEANDGTVTCKIVARLKIPQIRKEYKINKNME